MKLRAFPIIPTLIVIAAAGVMVALGFWQLGRADEKEALLASYAAVPADAAAVPYPMDEAALEASLYRKTSARCAKVLSIRAAAGTNVVGARGWAHIANCRLDQGIDAEVALGWSRGPDSPKWAGGVVKGIIGAGGKIVADPPLADLGPLAKPDPADLPNNHLAYAVQWFLFALTALVIYFLAVRARLKARAADGPTRPIYRETPYTAPEDEDFPPEAGR
ncbi:MAG: SURF1 family cytochrome oxidase biogenesis protein [Pontixanthobacter sp.]